MLPILKCFNMLAIGTYFAFTIFQMGTILVAQDISEKNEKTFTEDILDAHNYFRYKHASGQLELDDEMCKLAKGRAHDLRTPTFRYFPIGKCDENYSITDFDGTFDPNPFKIVSTWYEYGSFYDYDREPIDRHIDIFSKIVWKNTKRIGVGILVSDKKYYVAVIYSPCGCQIGQYFSNIIHPNVAAEINQQETNRLLGDLVKESD